MRATGVLAGAALLLLASCGDHSGPNRCREIACLERTLNGHGGRVTSVAFSPDGRTLATGSTDYTVRLWDIATGSTQHTLSGHTSSVLSVAFSPDGSLLASGSEDATVRLWRGDGSLVRGLGSTGFGVTSLVFSREGRLLLASSSDHTVRIWLVDSGGELLRLAAHVAPVNAVALAPDGASFASAGSTPDGRVRLWSFPAASPMWQAVGETAVWSLSFAPDGRMLAVGGSFGSVRLRSTTDGSEIRVLRAGDGPVSGLAFSPDGQLLAVTEAEAIRVFSPTSGLAKGRLAGHEGAVFALAFSPDGRYLASGGDDATARLWRMF